MSVQNVDAAEIAKFAALASDWWNPDGPLKTLHDINPLRLDYLASHATLRGKRVLDVACGGGLLTEGLASQGALVTGIDLAQASIEVARDHAAAAGLDIAYETTDVADLAARQPAAFDVVTCLELLEHVPDPGAIVTACSELLKPGGIAFFSTINRHPKSFLLAIVAAEHLLRWIPRGTHEYLKLVRPSELAGWCRRAGLSLKDITGLHFSPLHGGYTLGGDVDVNYFVCAIKPAG